MQERIMPVTKIAGKAMSSRQNCAKENAVNNRPAGAEFNA
jgi:hypothetical protein